MYVLGFIAFYLLVRYQKKKKKDFGVTKVEIENLYFYLIIGLIAGARLGYVLFYDLRTYLPISLRYLQSGTGVCPFTAD